MEFTSYRVFFFFTINITTGYLKTIKKKKKSEVVRKGEGEGAIASNYYYCGEVISKKKKNAKQSSFFFRFLSACKGDESWSSTNC